MPPVVNTYGVRKKKSRGLPKFILREAPTTDLFEALRIENIKEPKAIADAKRRERRKLKTVQKPAVPKPLYPLCNPSNADSAFDKLLDSSSDFLSSAINSSPRNVSSSPDVFYQKHEARRDTEHSQIKPSKLSLKGLNGVNKKRTVKKRITREDSLFALSWETSLEAVPLAKRLRANRQIAFANKENYLNDSSSSGEDSCASFPVKPPFSTCTTSVSPEVSTCEEKPVSPLSPILPLHGSTSTPCEKLRVELWPSPIPYNQSSSVVEHHANVFSNTKKQEESKDMFSSFEQNVGDSKVFLNDCAESNMLQSFDFDGKKSFINASEAPVHIETWENRQCSLSADLFQSETTNPSFSHPIHAEESCLILEPVTDEVGQVDESEFISTDFCSPLKKKNGVHSSDGNAACLNGVQLNPLKSYENCSSSDEKLLSLPRSNEEKPLKDCYVVIDRCDRNECFPTNSNNTNESCDNFDDLSVRHEGHNSKCFTAVSSGTPIAIRDMSHLQLEKDLSTCAGSLKDCYIVLDRCDANNCSPTSSRGIEESSVNFEDSFVTSDGCNFAAADFETSPATSVKNMSKPQCMENIISYLDELKLSPKLIGCNNSDVNGQLSIEEKSSLLNINSILSDGESSPKDVTQTSSKMIKSPRNVSGIILDYDCQTDAQRESTSNCSRTDAPVEQCVPVDDIALKKKMAVKTCDNFDSEVLLPRCDLPDQPPENSFSKLSISRPSNCRLSINPETIVLKPGKQWRRSLSILSKIRTSAGELSGCNRESLSSEDTKLKGKLWESAVHSVVQLQPVNDVIFEDIETSIISIRSSLGRLSTSAGVCENLTDSVTSVSSKSGVNLMSGAAEIFKRCGQDGPVSFQDCYLPSMKKNTKKIGEGVYGEVFFYSGSSHRLPSVIKVIPIEGSVDVNGEPQKKFHEILSEVCIAQELSNLRRGSGNVTSSFNEVQAIRCVQGCYPQWLQDLWHEYDETKGSENDSPEMFQEDQLYIVLELQNGGKDLESFIFSSADQGLAAFKQIAVSLAVAEKALNFEHRDLHWGNVLISCTKEKTLHYVLNGESISIPSKGIEVSIIDFTLSRINDPCSGRPVYFDLAGDDTLFTAQGDYQFDIYRLMKEYCGNKWETFTPKTNVAWLHYLLDKLCTMARYKNRSTKLHNKALNILLEMKDTVLMFENVSTFVNCPLFSK
ncbi:uncharacterized protein LOC113207823 [Frankliniella occidentalis]|uniref:non-specific serine/threonine protein kinase n=1 Tax=Frankliniella occidentalis TaxID=133901 RepID=A0A6J1SH51_FRAOC|nr:uncharacterized protein LOC113207823 [Frankliniella occidentalis]XP_026280323.1 uncharacterized protein LOC113207823 [Frankliniella occidentalis]